MNPLKQYFRRPAIYLKLPSNGQFYPEGSIDLPPNGEIPVFPMTAIDDITSKTPDSLFNGTALVEIIKSCIPAIKDPWQIPATDINAILVAIRTASSGNSFDIDSQCPKCETNSTYGVNLSGLLQSLKVGNYQEPLKIGDLRIQFKPLNYKKINDSNMVQFDMQVQLNNIENIADEKTRLNETSKTIKAVNENLFKLVANTIEKIMLPNDEVTNYEYILEYVKNTDKSTFETIREHSLKLREGSELKPLSIKCSNCSHEYEQNLNLDISDFFD